MTTIFNAQTSLNTSSARHRAIPFLICWLCVLCPVAAWAAGGHKPVNATRPTLPNTACYIEMGVFGGGTSESISDGQTTTSSTDGTWFGEAVIGASTTQIFTIVNSGCEALTIGAISFSGVAASDFEVTSPPAATLNPEQSTTFTVRFQPQDAGLRTATISIVNNHPVKNPYNFALQGVGICATGTTNHDFESITTNATSFTSGGATFNLTNFMVGYLSTDLGSSSPPSDGYFDSGFGQSRAAGSNLGGVVATGGKVFKLITLDVWPSTDAGSNVAAPPQTVILKGFKASAEVYSLTLTTYDFGQTPTPVGGKWHRIALPCQEASTDIDEFRLSFPSGSSCNYIAVDNFTYRALSDAPSADITVSDITSPLMANGSYRFADDGSLMPKYISSPGIGSPYAVFWSIDQEQWALRDEVSEEIFFVNPTKSLTPPCDGWELASGSSATGLPTLTGDCSATAYAPGSEEPPNYSFSAFSRTYAELSNGATTLSEIIADDEITGPITLPFNFEFAGESKNTIFITSNGWLSFDAPIATPQDNTAYYLNATPGGALFPLADDLAGDGMSFAGYEVTGSAPSRIFKIEWRNYLWIFNAQAYSISFQVWLYESSNIIDFSYRQESGDVEGGAAVIGIGKNIFSYLVVADASANPDTSNSVFYNAISARPASDQVYRFSPPGACTVPTTYALTGGGLFCAGSPVAIGLADSESDATYQLVRGGSTDVGSPVSGTGEAISFAAQSTAGTYTIVATRTAGGCTADMTGNATVTLDATAPSVTCPANVSANTSAGGTGDCAGVASWTAPTPTDNCSASIQSVSQASGTSFDVGETTVTYTVADAAGNTATCEFMVTIFDNEAPTIACPSNMTVNTSAGRPEAASDDVSRTPPVSCTATATWTAPTPSDNCSAGITNVSHTSGTLFDLGATTVTYTAEDAAGNIGTCTFRVTVADNVPPTFNDCPSSTTVNTSDDGTGNNSTVVSWTAPTLSDICDNSPTLTSSHVSGSAFAKGIHNLSFTATDDSGNSGQSCLITITVLDDEAPNMTACPENAALTTSADGAGDCTVLLNWTLPTATDNCDGTRTVSSTHPTNATLTTGAHTIVCSASDLAGHTTTCSFSVSVSDDENPQFDDCPPSVTVNTSDDGTGNNSTVVSWTAPTISDNCDGSPNLVASPASGSVFTKGAHNITFTATDDAGNSAQSCLITITVVDDEAPSITCPANVVTTTSAGGTGDCSGQASWTLPTPTDNCAGASIASVSPMSSSFAIGSNTVTYTAIDAVGLTATCSFTVTVTDNEAPTAVCQNRTVALDDTGAASVTTSQINNSSTDNCTSAGSLSLSLSQTIFDCDAAGAQSISLTVTDAAGNTSQCTATVTVLDLLNYEETSRQNLPGGLAGDRFGWSAVLSSSWGASGAPEKKVGTQNKQGTVGILASIAGWGIFKQVSVSDGAAIDYFGNAVSLDGSLLLAGAYGDNVGTSPIKNDQGSAVFFSQNSGGTNNWGQIKQVFAPDGAAYDYFGQAVSLKDGVAIVGANKAKIGSAAAQGAAYIFSQNLGGANNWGYLKKLTASDGAASNLFGHSAAQASGLAFVGAPGNLSNRGAVYIFGQNIGGADNWGLLKKIVASDGVVGDWFGASTSVSSDYALIGAPNKGGYMGAAYIFGKDVGGTDNWGQAQRLAPADCAANDRFGTAVALSGDYAYVSALRHGTKGSIYVFHKDMGGASNWGQIGKYMASDGSNGDQFGFALAAQGERILVGANLDDVSAKADIGSAYIFTGEDCPEPRPAFDHVLGKNIEKTEPRSDSAMALGAAPNPFRDELWLDISAQNGARLTLTDAAGRTVRQLDLPAGNLRYALITSDLQPGAYFLKIASEQGAQAISVVKVE